MNLFHISECWRLELRGKYPFSVNMGYFSPYMFFHMRLGLDLFLDLYISMAKDCNVLMINLQFIIQS